MAGRFFPNTVENMKGSGDGFSPGRRATCVATAVLLGALGFVVSAPTSVAENCTPNQQNCVLHNCEGELPTQCECTVKLGANCFIVGEWAGPNGEACGGFARRTLPNGDPGSGAYICFDNTGPVCFYVQVGVQKLGPFCPP